MVDIENWFRDVWRSFRCGCCSLWPDELLDGNSFITPLTPRIPSRDELPVSYDRVLKAFDPPLESKYLGTQHQSEQLPISKSDEGSSRIRLESSFDIYNESLGKVSAYPIGCATRVGQQFGPWGWVSSTPHQAQEEGQGKKKDELVLHTRWGVLVGRWLHGRPAGMADVAQRFLAQAWIKKALEDSRRIELLPSQRRRAEEIIARARKLVDPASGKLGNLPCDTNVKKMLAYLFGEGYSDTLMLLATRMQKLCAVQPTLAKAHPPCKVFGDIHGHLHDMVTMFFAFGEPGGDGPTFVFNGDFVDRGTHQLAVVGVLFALKLLFPTKVWLIRGNHEDPCVNANYGFRRHCTNVLGKDVGLNMFRLVHEVFEQLPIACLIEESILVLHGGIGDGKWTLDELAFVRRPLSKSQLYDPSNGWLMNILWSDPLHPGDERGDLCGVHSSTRTFKNIPIFKFNYDVTKVFCARNGLQLVVRSHQCRNHGPGFEVLHDNMIARVFTARDYDGHVNDGAVLLINTQDTDIAPKLQDHQEAESDVDLRRESRLTLRPQVLPSMQRKRLSLADNVNTVGGSDQSCISGGSGSDLSEDEADTRL